MPDSPNQRAVRVLEQAAALNLEFAHRDRGKWHSLITAEIVGALCDARDGCINVQDRLRIGDLMLGDQGAERRAQPRGEDAIAQAIADLPPGATMSCVICGGDPERKVGCPGCNGAGIHTVSRAMEQGHSGTLALKPCGCAVDWVGDGIAPDFLAQRREIWNELGYRTEAAAWSDTVRDRLTQGAGCHHERGAA